MAHQKGFTLIELLLILAIISIIAVMLIPNLLRARAKAQNFVTMVYSRDMLTYATSWLSNDIGHNVVNLPPDCQHASYVAESAYAFLPDSVATCQVEQLGGGNYGLHGRGI